MKTTTAKATDGTRILEGTENMLRYGNHSSAMGVEVFAFR